MKPQLYIREHYKDVELITQRMGKSSLDGMVHRMYKAFL